MIRASEKFKLSPPAMAGQLTQIAIVFVAYYLAGKLGQATANIRSGNLGPVWPAYGVALAAILIYGYRVWFGVAAAAFVVAWLSPVPAIAAAGQAAGATLAALTGAYLLRSAAKFEPTLSRLQDAMMMIVVGAFGSTLVSASIGVSALYATHVQSYSGLGRAWLIYWLGDATGALLVTPLVLTLPALLWTRPWRRSAELGMLLLLLTAASFAVFSDFVLFRLQMEVVAFALLPFVMWAAIRFGMSGATMANFIVATIATTETAFGYGPFSRNTPFINAVLLDGFFAVLAVSGMALAAVIAEREQAQWEREQLVREQAVLEARLRLATIVESSNDAVIGTDIDGAITDWNKAAENLYGYTVGEVIGKPIFLLTPPERVSSCAEVIKGVKQGVPVIHYETVRRKKDGTEVEVSITGSPILGMNGEVIGLSSIERDIAERKRQVAELRDSEERFRLAVHAGKMFAYEWDAATDAIVRSAESTTILGVDEAARLTGKQMLAAVHPDDRERINSALIGLSPDQPYLRISYRRRRGDGQWIWVERHSIAHFNEQGRIIRIVGMVADITERKQAEEALASAKSRLIEAQEVERTRIARELHDDIGQRLTLFTMQMEQLQRSNGDLPVEAKGKLDELRRQVLEISSDIQSMSHQLHSARLEYLGLASATLGFCREFSEKQHVEVDCTTHDLPSDIGPTISLCLFRVLQEALHNSLKHSGVQRFEVRLWGTADEIHLRVRDSGAGFNSATARNGRGLGLISMEERLKLLDGKFSVESQPNQGTTIHARVPFHSVGEPLRVAG